MAAVQQQVGRHIHELPVKLPDWLSMTFDHLDPAEYAAVQHALHDLPNSPPDQSRDTRFRRMSDPDDIYAMRVTPELRLYVRFSDAAPPEILDLVAAETLKRMYKVPDPFQDRE